MSAIKYVGRVNDFKGKTLWEIVGSLKNFGVGRVVLRNMFQRYPEPSYMRILKVEATPEASGTLDDVRKVKVTVEKTFRGRLCPKPVEIFSSSYKADYRLVPKHEEANLCKPVNVQPVKILPKEIELPPLLREFVRRETGNENPMMTVRLKPAREKYYRIAKDGEQPSIAVPAEGVGTPACPRLYEISS